MKKLSNHEKYGKSIRVSFRISPTAKDRLDQAADLFQLEPSQVAKCLLYLSLQVYEPFDNRRRNWRRGSKKRQRILIYERSKET